MIKRLCLDQRRDEQDAREHRLERALRVALFRRSCPDTMTLSDYQLGLLNSMEHARVHAHVARCPHCQAELARLDAFLAGRPAISGWISDAGFEWRRLARAGEQAGQVVIRLVKDALMPLPRLLPVRGEAQVADFSVYRQIVLHPEQTGGLDVQAEVRRSAAHEDAWQVIVKVQSPERWPELAGTAVKVQTGAWSREVITDEHGRAVVEGIPNALLDAMVIKVDSMRSLRNIEVPTAM
ncbi:MAG: zf-HC2 domain-containing protein [Anaerolineae bacterium]|nr:zf-HC2 domain-containing protein [Candidatus Roseilinea sp.]MDW8450931.1 zf-HC2 domain-containing protein [Anaerolineae bacterium]